MKDDRRKGKRRVGSEGFGLRKTLYIAGAILVLGVIAFFITVMIYNNNLEKIYSDLETTELGQATSDESNDNPTEEASSNLGKSIEELEKELKQSTAENENKKEENTQTKKQEEKKETEKKKETNTTKTEKTSTNTTNTAKENKNEENKEETPKEPTFAYPVEGEMMKEYAKDKLVYSETLKEWITHTGIDIKAEKTTVVKAAEEGKVTAIKNDPRYGTTVIIEHSGGYETRYANLLTAEFVNVGEKVTKGQTIGTVGNTGAFEILDDFHLHFELLKNGEYQDPMLYLK